MTIDDNTLAAIIARAEELAAAAPPLTVEQALLLRGLFSRNADIEELAS